jgi:predicted lipoprotein with Yx(FWY)xxD motif
MSQDRERNGENQPALLHVQLSIRTFPRSNPPYHLEIHVNLTRRSLALVAVGLGAVGALGLTACGDDDDVTATPAAESPAESPTDPYGGSDAAVPAGSSDAVTTADTPLGTILVDTGGNTLYAFVPDDKGPSTCVDECLAAWPALAGPVIGDGAVDSSLFGTAARPDDGSEQATYNDWPLYYYGGDADPGDTNGQGVNDVWFVVGADGALVRTAAG